MKDFVVDHDLDILAITETWTQPDLFEQNLIINCLCLTGYLFRHVSRETRGDGVAFKYKQSYKFKNTTTTLKIYKSFELANYLMNYSSRILRMVFIYRPSPSATNVSTLSMFLNEFRQFLESLAPP